MDIAEIKNKRSGKV